MSTTEEVRNASAQFYAALNRMTNGDAGPMAAIWSHSAEVTYMSPTGDWEVGWTELQESFKLAAQASNGGRVEMREQTIDAFEDLAYEQGSEHGLGSMAGEKIGWDSRVTNIYSREAGVWKILHHRIEVSPVMAGLVNRMLAYV